MFDLPLPSTTTIGGLCDSGDFPSVKHSGPCVFVFVKARDVRSLLDHTYSSLSGGLSIGDCVCDCLCLWEILHCSTSTITTNIGGTLCDSGDFTLLDSTIHTLLLYRRLCNCGVVCGRFYIVRLDRPTNRQTIHIHSRSIYYVTLWCGVVFASDVRSTRLAISVTLCDCNCVCVCVCGRFYIVGLDHTYSSSLSATL